MSESDNMQLSSSLSWVKDEINKSLQEARASLESYVEGGEDADASGLQRCQELIKQVRGTLQMVQLQGALLLTEEMLQLVDSLIEGDERVSDKGVAYEALMRAILQLPDYFAKVQSGQTDAAVILLPLINDLREAYGESAVLAEALFSPNYDGIQPPDMPDVQRPADGNISDLIKSTRQKVHIAMLGLFRGQEIEKSMARMIDLYEQYCVTADLELTRQLYWITTALCEGIADGGLDSEALPIKPLLGQVDRQSKLVIDNGEATLESDPPTELVRMLLYYVACSSSNGKRTSTVKDAFRLRELLPEESDLQKLRDDLAGPNAEVIETVIQGITQELERARDMLDIFSRTGEQDKEKLEQMVQSLRNAAGTVAMLGDTELQQAMNEHCDRIEGLIDGSTPEDAAGLDELAGFILQFENKLQSYRPSDGISASVAADEDEAVEVDSESWDVRQAVVKESAANMSTAKDVISAFAEAADDNRDQLEIASGLLQQIAGSLKIASLDRASDIIYALRSYIDKELIKQAKVPGEQEIEALAEAVSSADYYLEAVLDNLPNRGIALDMAESALGQLGYQTGDVDEELEQLAAQQTEEDEASEYHLDTDTPEELQAEGLEGLDVNVIPEVEGETFAEVEEVTVDVPEESEQEMLDRVQGSLEEDGGFDPNKTGEIEVSALNAAVESVDIDVPEESEQEMLERVQSSLEEDSGFDPNKTGEIEVSDLHASIEMVDVESADTDLADMDISAEEEIVEVVEPVITDIEQPQPEETQEAEEPETNAIQSGLMSESPLGDDLDEEIVEIFLEEAEEVLGELREHFPKWRDDPGNTDSLTIVRRSFHTLKGSGRMIGANQIGEFSWAIENLLNRVIDNSISASPEVLDAIGGAIDVLPTMVTQLQGGPPPEVDINYLGAVADALASGKPAPAAEAEKKIEKLAPVAEEEVSSQMEITEESSLSVPLDSDELRQVYTDETRQHLDGLTSFIEACHADMDSCYFHEPQVVILHTLHGGSATVGANDLKQIYDVLEPLAILFNEHNVKLDATLLDLFKRAMDQTELFLIDINGGEEKFVLDVELLEELQMLFQQKKDLFGAVTSAIDILKVIPEHDEVPEHEAVPPEHDDEALGEISSSLEDLHDLMATDIELSEVDETQAMDQEPGLEQIVLPSDSPAELPGADVEAAASEVPEAEGVAGDEVDTEILEIFMDEAEELLGSIEQSLNDWQEYPDDQELMIGVQRDIHTLKGGARMVNLKAIADISHAMETLLTSVVDGQTGTSDQMYSVLHSARDSLQDLYDGLKEGNYSAVADPGLIKQLETLKSGEGEVEISVTEAGEEPSAQIEVTSEPEEEFQADEMSAQTLQDISGGFELLDIFMEEAGELLESIDHTMDEWQNDENNMDLVIKLQRDVHTLKGGARMVNLAGIGDLGHALETLLTAIVDGHVEISRPLFDGMHEVKDELQTMFETARDGRGDSAVNQQMLNVLESLRTGNAVPLEPIGGPDSTSEEATPSHMLPALEDSSSFDVTPSNAIPAFEDSTQVTIGADAAETTPSTPMEALDEEDSRLTRIVETVEKAEKKAPEKSDKRTQSRVEHETIRVRSDLIDNLVNLAGETNIFRSRLEQQSSSFRFSLTELDQTVIRLQEQLKKLQAETDEQILSRHESEMDNPEHENFDPLEMDQYSTMQQLSRSLVESVGDLNSLQDMLGGLTRDSELLLLQQGRVNTELQDRLMQARVVPFAATMASRMRRITRQTCQQLGKRAELKIEGANEEMDRHVLDRMVAPLEHMLRNSIAHGIESPEERIQKGKPEAGTITVTVRREGGEIVIKVADDGAGLDTVSIRKKAESKGLIIENADITDDEVMQLVLTPGFSTAESVSQIAGRGVGMDVVNSEIRQLNGTLHIGSEYGKGATMTIRLPFTLSISQALLVRVGMDLYAIPLTSIEGVSRIGKEEAEQLMEDKDKQFQYGGDDYQLSSLGKLLGRQGTMGETDESRPAIILVRAGGHRVGFYIDELLGHNEIVVKSLGAQVSSVSGMAGGTILGDGRVALILDVPALVRMVGAEHGLSETQQVQVMETPKSVKIRVMVVDDSITVRRVTTRLLERHEMEVFTAKDGVDAVAKLEEVVPDVMLLDVEMPRMDGYELATQMRNDERYKNVPIVMITSRTGAKHRERAESIGVDRYLGKPYQEGDLLENINQVLEERQGH